MNKIYNKYQKLINSDNQFGRSAINAHFKGQEAADRLKNKILENKPIMIARFGANELNCILNYYFINQDLLGNFKNIICGIPFFTKMKSGILKNLNEVAGFFPLTEDNINRYCELSLNDLPEIDILGSWLNHEKFLFPKMNPAHIRVTLRDLTPVTNPGAPWTVALKDKKVLIIHPFENTIKSQYKKREFLFNNPEMLPDFELKTLQSVQSLAGNDISTGFKDWFEALESMKEKIDKIDYDIAILGCGAYGMPLAAHIKRMGKQAFHLGGETQIMFGIKGKRWEEPSYNYNNLFYNDYWVRPFESEIPQNSNKVEDGCYW